ncbi:B12-binding domain-containing radical SAM protein [Roseibium alexandrii]|uniref:Magnesium-protoporphyrin IX monomethyl ester anaerobic oxidative cyclase n=1 Tax=Roseibium alexandrii TaxID=388408 RepID=A0A0M6ZY73_9HYPH|nr:radical SAM protein [Roseibium alexandrii]CTQ67599.1 magnesium-protoporphyrin IX monomethyl ester anaerobic oxidative cyclase [Roseibium alexandrii]
MDVQDFHFVMIKPTHYDDDGYPIQWLRSAIPSNTLASLNGLAEAARERDVLGEKVRIHLHTYDETNKRIRPQKIAQDIRRRGGKALIALVGVQSNQFPRATDLAREFIREGLPTAIGGFHVSGCISMLDDMPEEMVALQEEGVCYFAGEAEERRLDQVFRDAFNDDLKPLYNFMADLPSLEGEPTPILPTKHIQFTAGSHSSFDLGRGCPFQCSFCTIINVQGRKSRFRSADDLEQIIRDNYAQGIDRFFITDDNFARNREWEPLFDRLIELREEENFDIKFIIQVDTLCHRIENFIEKATRAGVNRVFIGLENINPDNLLAAKKRQNKITEYRQMLQKWRDHGATTYAGYIIGFPGDTKEAVLRDVEIIKKELPLDLLEFFFLTPLPGSEDHKVLLEKGIWMDPDLNKYDLNHRVSHHPKMSDVEWEEAYREAWSSYYSDSHIETVLRRAAAHKKGRPGNKLFLMMWFKLMIECEGVHPLEGGYFRLKFRKDRRNGLPIENPLVFYPRYVWEVISKHWAYVSAVWRVHRIYRRVKAAPGRRTYSDLAIAPMSADMEEDLAMITETRGGKDAVAKSARDASIVKAAKKRALAS